MPHSGFGATLYPDPQKTTYKNTENMGDFIVLSQIEKNLDTEMFGELLILLKKKRNKNV